jgi:hypothetical protein
MRLTLGVGVGFPYLVQLVEQFLTLALDYPAVGLVGLDALVLAGAHLNAGPAFPGLVEPAHVGQFGGPVAAGEATEHAPGFDRAELPRVAHEHDLGPGFGRTGGELVQLEGTGQAGLVHDHELPGLEAPALDLGIETFGPAGKPGGGGWCCGGGGAGELLAERGQFRAAFQVLVALPQPLGRVLGGDAQFLCKDFGSGSRGGQAHHRTRPVLCLQGGPERRERRRLACAGRAHEHVEHAAGGGDLLDGERLVEPEPAPVGERPVANLGHRALADGELLVVAFGQGEDAGFCL